MKIGMLFPDYGSQYVGMGKELYDTSRIMQEYFEEASTCLNINFVKLCFASSEQELAQIDHAYTSVFLLSCAISSLLKERGISAHAVSGYGIGQWSALHAAGSLSLPDGLYFLSKYAQFYHELLTTLEPRILEQEGMEAVKVRELCTEYKHASISAYHTPNKLRVSGLKDEMIGVEDQLKEQDAQTDDVSVFAGLHSPLMKPVQDHLRTYLEKIDFHDLQIPLISTIDGSSLLSGNQAREKIMEQIVNPIRWDKVISSIAGWDLIIYVGPGDSPQKIVRDYYPEKRHIAINSLIDVENLLVLIKK
ncbi:MAG TPA: ACP S-malonyltransferase [Candidatus Babeliales bacterium]|nr:ACP S-malonyltransferase [Candidatus Babeliales bacterium]